MFQETMTEARRQDSPAIRRHGNETPTKPEPGTIAVVIPYYNEAKYIGATLRSISAQYRRPDRIVLVDNASTDGSEAVCRQALAGFPSARLTYLHEPRPGKVNALEAGLARIDCEFVTLCDADVVYPPHYLERALRLFRAHPDAAAVMGLIAERDPDADGATRQRLRRIVDASRRHPSKCLTGGAGQIFRTEALKRAGGFSAERWNYVLMDHEIVNRVRRHGASVYHEDMWCLHSDRRADRGDVRWNQVDRMLYRYLPSFLGDWYFRDYLGPRLAARRMTGLNLRRQPWARSTP